MIVLTVTSAWDAPSSIPAIYYSEPLNTWNADIQYVYH